MFAYSEYLKKYQVQGFIQFLSSVIGLTFQALC